MRKYDTKGGDPVLLLAIGVAIGSAATLFAIAWMTGRSERRERKQSSYVCENCPWDR